MSAQSNERTATDPHAHVWELLPWYANGTLGAQEDNEVERHLAACARCRSELERCRLLASAVKLADDEAWVASPAHFSRVMAHIDRAGTPTTVAAEQQVSIPVRVREWFFGSPRSMRWAFAVQGALVVGLAGALFATILPSTPSYDSLSRSTQQVPRDRALLHVVFAEDISGKELRNLLTRVDAQIVSGPSPAGVYTIELSHARTDSERTNRTIETFRSEAKVRLAEVAENSAAR